MDERDEVADPEHEQRLREARKGKARAIVTSDDEDDSRRGKGAAAGKKRGAAATAAIAVTPAVTVVRKASKGATPSKKRRLQEEEDPDGDYVDQFAVGDDDDDDDDDEDEGDEEDAGEFEIEGVGIEEDEEEDEEEEEEVDEMLLQSPFGHAHPQRQRGGHAPFAPQFGSSYGLWSQEDDEYLASLPEDERQAAIMSTFDNELEERRQDLYEQMSQFTGSSQLRSKQEVSVQDIEKLIISRRKQVVKGARGRRRVDELPPYLTSVMGQAMGCFTNRDFDTAKKYINEIIRNSPKVPESYRLLALIAKEEGDVAKETQYMFFAATFAESDVHTWMEVGDMSREQGIYDQAITAFEAVLKHQKTNPHALQNLAQLHAHTGNITKAIKYYNSLQQISPLNLDIIVPLARLYAQKHEEGQAAEMFEKFFASQEGHDHYQLEHVNYLAELYEANGEHHKTIALIDREQEMYDDPQQFPLDLIVKRTVAYIRLKEDNHALAQVGLQFLAETEDASTVSDLFLEVGKAYEHIRKFEVAIAYFNKVAMFMDKDDSNIHEVYIHLAICNLGKNNLSEAQMYYNQVIEAGMASAPSLKGLILTYERTKSVITAQTKSDVLNVARRYQESENYKRKPRQNKADMAFGEFDVALDSLDVKPKLKARGSRSGKGLQAGRMDVNLIDLAENLRKEYGLLCTHLVAEPRDFASIQQICMRLWNFFDIDASATSSSDSDHNTTSSAEGRILSPTEWLIVVTMYASLKLRSNDAGGAYELLSEAIRSNLFKSDALQGDLRAALIVVGLSQDEQEAVVDHARWFCQRKRDSYLSFNVFWLAFARFPPSITIVDESQHEKYIARQVKLTPSSNIISHLSPGNQFILHQNATNALNSYVNAWTEDPNVAETNLHMGAVDLLQAMSRNTPNRHFQIAQGIGFILRYHELRGGNQEANYNLARAFQSVGLYYLAIPYYESALAQEPLTPAQRTVKSQDELEPYDLKRESAWNLVAIYMRSGNELMAADLVRRFLQVV